MPMKTYSAADLAKSPYRAADANSAKNRAQQVIAALKAKDDTAADDDKEAGHVSIKEDCVTLGKDGSYAINNAPDNLITSDSAACLANGKLAVPIKGQEQWKEFRSPVVGFKGMVATLNCDSAGNIHDARASGYELMKHGFQGTVVYSYNVDKHGRGVYDIDIGGWHEKTTLNADGSIAKFQQGCEPEGLRGFAHRVWDKITHIAHRS